MKKFSTILFIIFIVASTNINVFAGILSGIKETDAEILYDKINEFLEQHADCSPESFEDICRDYIKSRCKSPVILDKNIFELESCCKTIVYRGIPEEEYADALKNGEIYIGKNVSNVRGNGIYTSSNKFCAEYFSDGNPDGIVTMFLNKTDNIISNSYLNKITQIMLRHHPKLAEILKLNPRDLKFDSARDFFNKASEELKIKINNLEVLTMNDIKNFYEEYVKNNKEEYNRIIQNRKYYFKDKTVAIFYNKGLQARLLDYDAIYTDEFDEDIGLDIQEYLILDSGILTICQ